jgi:hypothetical protein
MASQNIPSPKSGASGDHPPEVVLPPEELAIIKERLKTVDNAVTAEELLAMLDDDLRRGAAGR